MKIYRVFQYDDPEGRGWKGSGPVEFIEANSKEEVYDRYRHICNPPHMLFGVDEIDMSTLLDLKQLIQMDVFHKQTLLSQIEKIEKSKGEI